MNGKRTLCIAIGLVTAPVALPAWAQQQEDAAAPVDAPPPANGLTELTDEEMGDMRGRYTVSSNTVAWFGVTMVSTWQTQAGAQLQSRMTVTMDASKVGAPKVTFQPHVSITAVDAPMPVPGGQREIDSAGLANVNGMTQAVQVAGDANIAENIARITIRDGSPQGAETTASAGGAGEGEGVTSVAASAAASLAGAAPAPVSSSSSSLVATTSVAGMNAVAQLENNSARVLLQIDGQGAVQQWINSSGMGQTIQLAADGQRASNWMELDVVRSTSQVRTVLGQNVAQAIAMSRGIAVGY